MTTQYTTVNALFIAHGNNEASKIETQLELVAAAKAQGIELDKALEPAFDRVNFKFDTKNKVYQAFRKLYMSLNMLRHAQRETLPDGCTITELCLDRAEYSKLSQEKRDSLKYFRDKINNTTDKTYMCKIPYRSFEWFYKINI